MKNKKSNLDERQEQIMLQIEHVGCWIAYWGLLISILVQEIVYRGDFRYVLAEWIVFMVLCIYVLAGCIRNGLWDRHIKPTVKNNVIASLIAGGVLFLFTFIMVYRNFPEKPVGAVADAHRFLDVAQRNVVMSAGEPVLKEAESYAPVVEPGMEVTAFVCH